MLENSPQIERDAWLIRLSEGALERELAIEELRTILVRGLERSLRHRYGGSVQAEDVAQETLLKVLSSLDTFQGRSKFTTWAMSIAIRIGISQLRRHYYRDISLNQHTRDGDFTIDVPAVEQEHDTATSRDGDARNVYAHLPAATPGYHGGSYRDADDAPVG